MLGDKIHNSSVLFKADTGITISFSGTPIASEVAGALPYATSTDTVRALPSGHQVEGHAADNRPEQEFVK